MILACYILLLAALALHAPSELLDPAGRAFVLAAGPLLIWRYGWGLVHFSRAQIYKRLRFPRLRAKADRLWAAIEAAPPPVYCVCTSYRIRPETSTHVFRALAEEARRYPGPVVIVASLVEMADQRLVKHIFHRLAPPDRVRLILVRMAGQGKRDALAAGLMAVARDRPAEDAVVAVLDGDTVVAPGTLARTVPFFGLRPEIGGLTTDEDAVVDGGRLKRDWHRLRFAQRQLLMCSMALSGRLLAMTGRLSLYRVGIATRPSFIEAIRADYLDHWRLGRIRLLTGEDKSTWQWLLAHDQRMFYVPDVRVLTVEHPPHRCFFIASTMLMQRWFGNMLRSSTRAITMGPGRIGLFTWWSLIDQRVSMWTPLVMPLGALAFSLIAGPLVLYAYLLWVMTTRLFQALMLLTVRDTISGLYPPLILYGQVHGALVKTWVLFRPDRQGWTRQPIAAVPADGRLAARRGMGSAYAYGVAMLALCVLTALYTGALPLPSGGTLAALPGRVLQGVF